MPSHPYYFCRMIFRSSNRVSISTVTESIHFLTGSLVLCSATSLHVSYLVQSLVIHCWCTDFAQLIPWLWHGESTSYGRRNSVYKRTLGCYKFRKEPITLYIIFFTITLIHSFVCQMNWQDQYQYCILLANRNKKRGIPPLPPKRYGENHIQVFTGGCNIINICISLPWEFKREEL